MSDGVYNRRFPFVELYEFLRSRHTGSEPFTFPMCDEKLGFSFGYSARNFHRDRMLTVWQADRFACRVGVHPFEVWDDYFDLAADRAKPRRAFVA